MKDANELRQLLRGHYGTDTVWKHGINPRMLYTDGVRAFAQNAGQGAYWLLDILATEPAILREVRTAGIAFVKLSVSGSRAVLLVTDGGKGDQPEQVVYRRDIDITDCPEGDWIFYFENMMVMLPSER